MCLQQPPQQVCPRAETEGFVKEAGRKRRGFFYGFCHLSSPWGGACLVTAVRWPDASRSFR